MSSRIRYFRTENPERQITKPITIGGKSYVVNLNLKDIGYELIDYDNGTIVKQETEVNMTFVKAKVKELLQGMGMQFESEIRRSKKEVAAVDKVLESTNE